METSGSRTSGQPQGGRRDLALAGALWLGLTAVGELLVQLFVADGFPVVASREGEVADDAILLLTRLVVPVFAFVVVVIAYSAVRFRAREGEEGDSPVQVREDRRFSWGWLAGTTAITLVVIVTPGITGLTSIAETRDEPDPLVVEVTANQWQWSFDYPDLGVSGQQELVLPVGRPVRFRLASEDVIHSFWVPAFRIKEDVVPGETRDLYLTPERTISTTTSPLARVQCAELCGVGHTDMQSPVRVVEPGEFDAWVEETSPARAGGGMGGG